MVLQVPLCWVNESRLKKTILCFHILYLYEYFYKWVLPCNNPINSIIYEQYIYRIILKFLGSAIKTGNGSNTVKPKLRIICDVNDPLSISLQEVTDFIKGTSALPAGVLEVCKCNLNTSPVQIIRLKQWHRLKICLQRIKWAKFSAFPSYIILRLKF